MSSKYYFAYGSNLNQIQMKQRCPSSRPFQKAQLKDYRLTFRANKRGIGVADIEYYEGEVVHGALYKVEDSDIKRLDRFEGHPFIYERHVIKVNVGKKEYDAIVYAMKDGFDKQAPEPEYFQTIAVGYRHWELTQSDLLKAAMRILNPEEETTEE